MSRRPQPPFRDGSSQSFEMRDTPIGYHAPPEQLPGRSPPPEFKREPIPHISSISISEPNEYGLRTETTSTTSKQSLLRRANTTLATNNYHWILEICAVVFSIGALAAIAVLLPLYNNKPLTSWDFQFSLNTVISVLGATSRATLAFAVSACISQGKWNWFRRRDDTIMVFDRFEEASRGPWGSVRLLWWSKMRHWMALGALSTVILVGFEPFLQAIITFEGKEVSTSDPLAQAMIGKSSKLDVGAHTALTGAARMLTPPETSENGEVMVLSMTSDYDFGSLAAIWSGFSNLSSVERQKASFACPSGNCTWAPYASIAVCSACQDISKHISKSTGKTNLSTSKAEDDLTSLYFDSASYPILLPNISANYIKYEIPVLGMNLSNVDGAAVEALKDKNLNISNVGLTAKATSQPANTLSFQDYKSLIVSFAIMEAGREFREKKDTWENTAVTAQECALYFCTNIYKSDVNQGNLQEDVLGSYSNRNLDSFVAQQPEYTVPSAAYNAYANYTLNFDEWDMERTDLQLTIDAKDYRSATGLAPEQDLKFNISQNAAGSITALLMNEFARRASPLATKQLVYPTGGQGVQPHVISSLGASRNLTATFETVAASMSKYVRDLALENEPHTGEARHWVVFIRVEWGFLSLPLVALLGGCLFCLLSMIETKRLGLPAWRGSSLAGLAHGLDTRSRDRLREADGRSQMEAHAKHYKVRFMDSDSGPELRLSRGQNQ